jgi:hypothetical protein
MVAKQGITSFSVAPSGALVDPHWVNDIANLGTLKTGRLLLRTKVEDPGGGVPTALYNQAFGLYKKKNIKIYVVFPPAFMPQTTTTGPANAPLTPGMFSNPYINAFAQEAANVAQAFLGSDVQGYIIWNEPNKPATGLPPANFAAIVYQCYQGIKGVPGIGNVEVYPGGIIWPYAVIDALPATNNVVQYLHNVQHAHSGAGIPLAWDAVNVHIHNSGFGDADMKTLRGAIDAIFAPNTLPVVVGEWGLQHYEELDVPGSLKTTYEAIRAHFDKMWFFQHPNRDDPSSDAHDDWGLVQWQQGSTVKIVASNALWNDLRSAYS